MVTKKQLRAMIRNDKIDAKYFTKAAKRAKSTEERRLQRRLAFYARRNSADAKALLKIKNRRK